MNFPEISSWVVDDACVGEKARVDERPEYGEYKYSGRLGASPNADQTHVASNDLSRRKAVKSTVVSQKVQKKPRKKGLPAKTAKGRTVHLDFASKLPAKAFNVYRISQPRGSKDRHSKVITSKGPRDRRMRLSVDTATSLYELQDKLGLDQPSQTVEWLLLKAQPAIRELALPAYSNTAQVSLLYQNLTFSQKLDQYGSILAATSFPASTTASNSNSNTDAQKGGTVMKRASLRGTAKANPNERKANRTKARERARQRTREKSCAKQSQPLIDNCKPPQSFGFVKKSFASSMDTVCENGNGNAHSSFLVQDSTLLGDSKRCRSSHSSFIHPQSDIQSSLQSTLHCPTCQQEGSSLQSMGSISYSNPPIVSEKPAPDFGQGFFPLSAVSSTCCAQCLVPNSISCNAGLECISEGQSSSNNEIHVEDARNICLKPFEEHQSSTILTAFSPISCFPSPPYQFLDGGYYAHDYTVGNSCQ
ncbi:hypothetical protein SUGI_1055990 [Cryptomeria japonica]|uniref:uncharacterized protein LOC131060790 n=1 Tax=Cryptomeria japonica TaxID=3369 RepID=UPI002414A0B3|nr:uncharacterized protein LOC131060790 [Cryptomeria japonica]GLJ49749.1 hypothetical protein SUGI_1055990 [Cryptomeria japonica]